MRQGLADRVGVAGRTVAGILLLASLSTTLVAFPTSAFELRPRAGGGLHPDGPVAGVQATITPEGGLLSFAPSVDLTWPEGGTATAYNLDVLLGPLEISDPVSLYCGLGHTFLSISGSVLEGNTAVLGAYFGERYLAEARFGFDQAPDFRLLVGFRLRLK